MHNKFRIITTIFFITIIGIYYFTKKEQAPILKATVGPAKPKRFIAWNKKQFERQKGAQAINAATFTAFGANNITQLENINGYTFEATGEVEI